MHRGRSSRRIKWTFIGRGGRKGTALLESSHLETISSRSEKKGIGSADGHNINSLHGTGLKRSSWRVQSLLSSASGIRMTSSTRFVVQKSYSACPRSYTRSPSHTLWRYARRMHAGGRLLGNGVREERRGNGELGAARFSMKLRT